MSKTPRKTNLDFINRRRDNSEKENFLTLKDTSVNIATAFSLANITSETIARNGHISPRQVREMRQLSPSAFSTVNVLHPNLESPLLNGGSRHPCTTAG